MSNDSDFDDVEFNSDQDIESDQEEEEINKKNLKKQTTTTTTAKGTKRKLAEKAIDLPIAQLPYTDRVFIIYLPNKWLEEEGSSSSLNYQIVNLPNPKTQELSRYIIQKENNIVLEINKFQNKPSSWFMNNTVRHDGSLYLASPIDPLFLLIPFLEKLRSLEENKKDGGLFGELSSMKNDEKYSSLSLVDFNKNDQVSMICEVRDMCGYPMHRLDDEKLFIWLKCKVKQISQYLKESNTNVFSTATSKEISLNIPVTPNNETLILMSIGFLSEYLSDRLIEKLNNYYGVTDKRIELEKSFNKQQLQQQQLEATSTTTSKKLPKRQTKKKAAEEAPKGNLITNYFK